jgi:adenine-specific DNA-methyltransferase
MTFRYIGSKARLVEPLANAIRDFDVREGQFVDAFSGTGAVSEIAADLGWDIWANDALESAIVMTSARLASNAEVSMDRLGGYASAIAKLNDVRPIKGVMWQSYSPASACHDKDGIERRYFTADNAARLDGIRAQIAEWAEEGSLTECEERLLIADLISATNRVANIAGTYGCFLSTWQKSALRPLHMEARDLRRHAVKYRATVGDVSELQTSVDDLVYLDPPYTKRQYASYYHILETLTLGDEPTVEGVSGLRPWKEKASDFCYKTRALNALLGLVGGMAAKRILISYSCEGHVDLEDFCEGLERTGVVKCTPVAAVGRYRPNRVASANGHSVTEFLLSYVRSDAGADASKVAFENAHSLDALSV